MQTLNERLETCAKGGSIIPNRKLAAEALARIADLERQLAAAREIERNVQAAREHEHKRAEKAIAQLAEEKALADRLLGDLQEARYGMGSWEAVYASHDAYRKARGM